MCDILLGGGPGMCDKVWQVGGGSKLAKNSVTDFMDGPLIECKLLCSICFLIASKMWINETETAGLEFLKYPEFPLYDRIIATVA